MDIRCMILYYLYDIAGYGNDMIWVSIGYIV
jgi:hypothetical protein